MPSSTPQSSLLQPDNIETLFVQSEAQFQLKEVTSSLTKFDYCIQSMVQEVAVKILDLIHNPLAVDPYCHLKDRLLIMYAHTYTLENGSLKNMSVTTGLLSLRTAVLIFVCKSLFN